MNRCFFCGSPCYEEEGNIYHPYQNCRNYKPSSIYKILKIGNFRAIISEYYIHGIYEVNDYNSIRLPKSHQIGNEEFGEIKSEFWVINEIARRQKIIPENRLLTIKVHEQITQ